MQKLASTTVQLFNKCLLHR